jgi:thiol-disulfide isomerase/thioredoxin
MMKHFISFLVITSLLFISCRPKTQSNFQSESSEQTGENYSLPEEYAEEVIVVGKVLNREFYPKEKELTLIIPFFREMGNKYCAPILEDDSFSFRFPVFAKLREVSIRNYAEHLYVHPGDSIYVEIDFKDMFHPKVTGDSEKLNQEVLAFTENAYYYIQNYSIKYGLDFDNFEAELKKEYNFRLERRNEYIQKHKPMQDVILFTEELLKQDYYCAILRYVSDSQQRTRKEINRYHALLPEINKLYNKGILSARLYDIAEEVIHYISYGAALKNGKYPSLEDVMSIVGENALNQYLCANAVANSMRANDTLALVERRAQYDSIVKMPHLRAQITQIYNQTKSYLENPQPVSDNLLYGQFHEDAKLKTPMPYMEPIYEMLEKDCGKVIYFDFWARWCPPCLAEMEPLKQLRSKYSTEDLVIYSICGSEPKEEWEECLDKYSLRNRGIECIYANDFFGKEDYQKIRNQWKIHSLPYYILVNRKGQIIDFGSSARPSNPKLCSRIEEAVKEAK